MTCRFGDFTFDPASAELRRDGEIVRLQAQPAQVLALLVERAGEVVTRETLRDAIWGRETFVDFDKGLNFAVAQVRAALGDSADAPTYIRTLPKRGYQFIATVEAVPAPATLASSGASGVDWTSRVVGHWIRIALAMIVAVAAVAGFVSWRRQAPPTLAVIAFDNETGAPELDRYAQTLTDALVAELTARGDGRVGIIGNAAALRTTRPFRDLASIGQAVHARYVVIGQVQRDGDRVRLLAHLIRLPEQTHLWVTRIERGASDPPVLASDAARRISDEFLRKL
jgi:DNA-binding winged helix-turn-helix (wHTH) protein/TolB-like protein